MFNEVVEQDREGGRERNGEQGANQERAAMEKIEAKPHRRDVSDIDSVRIKRDFAA